MADGGFEHSVDCQCRECERIRAMLRRNVKKGKIHLVVVETRDKFQSRKN